MYVHVCAYYCGCGSLICTLNQLASHVLHAPRLWKKYITKLFSRCVEQAYFATACLPLAACVSLLSVSSLAGSLSLSSSSKKDDKKNAGGKKSGGKGMAMGMVAAMVLVISGAQGLFQNNIASFAEKYVRHSACDVILTSP